MGATVRARTIVLPDSRVEAVDTRLVPGTDVEIHIQSGDAATVRRSAVDILAEAPRIPDSGGGGLVSA